MSTESRRAAILEANDEAEQGKNPHHARRKPDPPDDLLAMIEAKDAGRPFDKRAFDDRVRSEVEDVVRRQSEAGIDVISDGEEGKSGFFAYIDERLSGFEYRKSESVPRGPRFADMGDFPEYSEMALPQMVRPVCTGPITYTGHALIQATSTTCEQP